MITLPNGQLWCPKMYPPKLYSGPTIQSRSAARRAAQDLVCTKVYEWKILHRTNIYNIFRWGGNPLASSKWISHLSFVRQHSPTEALDQSCFLPSATTLLYFRQSNHPHAFACSIFLHTVFNKQRKSCLRKQFGQPTKLSRGLIAVLYFFFLSKSRNTVHPRHESANTKNQIKMNMIA